MIVLEFLHRNHYIYQDLKPNNVMVDENKTIIRMINLNNLINNGICNQNISNNFG